MKALLVAGTQRQIQVPEIIVCSLHLTLTEQSLTIVPEVKAYLLYDTTNEPFFSGHSDTVAI